MERFQILKVEKQTQCGEKWISVLLKDIKKDHDFWIDCSLIDGYGYRLEKYQEESYIDWDFNQYIFHLDYEEDIKAKDYQKNPTNVVDLDYFIDDNNEILKKYFEGWL